MHSLKLPSSRRQLAQSGRGCLRPIPKLRQTHTLIEGPLHSRRPNIPAALFLTETVFLRGERAAPPPLLRETLAKLTRGKYFSLCFPLGQPSQRRSWCTVVRQWLKLRPQFFALNCSGKAKQKTVGTHCILRVRPSAAAAHKARPAASSGPSRIDSN